MSVAIHARKPKRRGLPEVPEAVTAQYFTITRWGSGYAVTVQWRGHPVDTVLCRTLGEANRERQRLSDLGLVGYVPRGVAW